MTTTQIRRLLLAAVAVLAFAATGATQEKSSALLNVPEVRQLVARAEPADNARLSAHFTALAEQYAREAKRHIAMSKSSVGNPSRTIATGMSAHCTRLAELNTQSATTARELAAHHQKLATGVPSTPPAGSASLQSGAGARRPTDKELADLAAKATTPADHRGLEEYFLTLAKRYTADADEHVRLAQTYRGTRLAAAAVHQDALARLTRESAREANDAAAMHEQLAGIGR